MTVPPTRVPLRLTIAMLLALGCGGRERELREWTPADHQPAPGGGGVPDTDEAPGAGAALFAVHCAGCHGTTGRGDGPAAPPMARAPDLTEPMRAAARTDAEVAAIVRQGRGMMPGFASVLSPEGVQAVVAHVRALAAPAAISPSAAEPERVPVPAPDEAPE